MLHSTGDESELYAHNATTPAALPFVSVVIPCYNYGRFLAEAVDSVLMQRYPACEVIVIDDGSSDLTACVAQSYGGRVRYIHQKNSGVSAARNTGVRAARGEWVALLDADDTWRKDKLLHQMRCAAEHPELCLIGAVARHCHKKNPTGETFSRVTTAHLLGALPFGASSVAGKRSVLLQAGLFDESKRLAEDRDLWLKMSLRGGVGRVNLPLWSYRFHSGQTINNSRDMAAGYQRVLDDFFAAHPRFLPLAPRARAYCHFDAAVSYLENGSRRHALWHCLQSMRQSLKPLDSTFARGSLSRTLLLAKCLMPNIAYAQILSAGKIAQNALWRLLAGWRTAGNTDAMFY
jgi:glycosyltransferase involved in cell wall biosynthesis